MNKTILAEGATRFNADVSSLQLIGGFSNNVFECTRNDEKIILKFYPSLEYQKDAIMAELDWIKFLFTSGVNVTEPLHSNNNQLLEVIQLEHEEECYVLAFEKAKGTFINTSDSGTWNKDIFYKLGQTLGRIHFLAKDYQPSDNIIKTYHWNMGVLFSKPIDYVSARVAGKWEIFINEINQLPMDIEAYGMIHNDLHPKNFHLYNNDIILFDFGDCEHNWFVYDIAIVLYHAIQSLFEEESQKRKDFAVHFLKSFLQGYLEENNLDTYWLTKLPFFLNYRQLFSYIYFQRFLNEEQKNNKKLKQILNTMKERIESDTPYITLSYKDFT
ncbi:phosphotransferase [Salipaludibacillus sp. LMS25]|jgi:Ser/Thr protein kinase RdoA (MazF antagonist)|uniref:phosphotransferase enzyme family protein n=1 Tax=Salipaludibacillus sp. LMS25 TaxID=2924031 RepID=UPI0020D14957|nr:phosphotransferase [Salipaludibacillus sp. LMS25]UTR15776.1 phosphotransferase [Salipaludibacillus sp. LMS25]